MNKVIVIGAGILGASAAYQLSKLGAEVIIIDRKDVGQATDAAAGLFVHGCLNAETKHGIVLLKREQAFIRHLFKSWKRLEKPRLDTQSWSDMYP